MIREGARNHGKEINVIVNQFANITLTSIAERHPDDVTLMSNVRKDRAMELKRENYKEYLQKNKTFCELVNLEQDLSILKVFQENVDRRNLSGKQQTCFSFNEVIFAV